MVEKENAQKKEVGEKRFTCPYCDAEVDEAVFPYCSACKIEIFHCPVCHSVVERGNMVCPQCGTSIREL